MATKFQFDFKKHQDKMFGTLRAYNRKMKKEMESNIPMNLYDSETEAKDVNNV